MNARGSVMLTFELWSLKRCASTKNLKTLRWKEKFSWRSNEKMTENIFSGHTDEIRHSIATFGKLQYPKGCILRAKKKTEEIRKRSAEEKAKARTKETRKMYFHTAPETCRLDFERAPCLRIERGNSFRKKNCKSNSTQTWNNKWWKCSVQNSLFWSMQQVIHRRNWKRTRHKTQRT